MKLTDKKESKEPKFSRRYFSEDAVMIVGSRRTDFTREGEVTHDPDRLPAPYSGVEKDHWAARISFTHSLMFCDVTISVE